MKVKNTTIYMGRDERYLRHGEEQAAGKQKNGKSIFGANLNKQEDPVLMKKRMAQEKAMKIVGDTFDSDRKLDAEQDARKEKVKELIQQAQELKSYIADQEALPEEEMTEEMKASRDEAIREYRKQYDATMQEVKSELMTIEQTRIERLKASPMVTAQDQAADIMEAASKEIVDMLMQEGKDHIDEEQEKREEQAEKIAKEKEEEEERIEKSEERKEEAEALAEAIRETDSGDLQKEIEEMLNELKLIEEDLKGAAVDTKL